MTIAALDRLSGPYTGNGSTTVFVYDFPIFLASELAVYVGSTLSSSGDYAVTGVGDAAGGTIVFTGAPAAGSTIWIFGRIPVEQQVDLSPGVPISSSGLETALDRFVMMVQELYEWKQRVVTLEQTVLPALRNLVFPLPGAGKLLGWNVLGTAVTLYDSVFQQITVTTTSVVYAQATASVVSSNGAAALTASALIPSGARVHAVVLDVTTTFGAGNGLTGLALGDSAIDDRWGSGIARTSGTQSVQGGYQDGGSFPVYTSAENVYLVAEGGTFDATGAADITVIYSLPEVL